MPSRLRILIGISPGSLPSGTSALALIRRLDAAKTWPRVDWEAINREGVRKHLWQTLQVWRERRGVRNQESSWKRARGFRGVDPPTVSLARVRARARRGSNVVQTRPSVGRMFSIGRANPPRIRIPGLSEPTPPVRSVRTGIFA